MQNIPILGTYAVGNITQDEMNDFAFDKLDQIKGIALMDTVFT